MDLDQLRDDLARTTHRGIGMPAAGIAFWLASAQLLQVLPQRKAILAMFFATGAVFPLGLAISKLIGADLFARGHPLTKLGMTLNFVQFAYWPILFVLYGHAPDWVVFAMATLFCSHFLPYGWLYRSAGYAMLGIGGVVVPIALAVAGMRRPEVLAVAMAALHAAAVARVHAENRRSFAHAAE